MQLRDAYLDVTLRELLALHACGRPRGESVAVDVVHAAVDVYAKNLERARVAAEADEAEWLARQIEGLTTAADEPGGAP